MSETKICTGPLCEGAARALSEFSRKSSAKDGLQPRCKKCHSLYLQGHYRGDPDYYKDKAYKRNKRVRINSMERVICYLREHPCVDCGETNPIFLEFDHVRGTKKMAVSVMLHSGHSWEAILEEIKKCEVRCVKCHWLVTLQRRGWSGFEFLTETELAELKPLNEQTL